MKIFVKAKPGAKIEKVEKIAESLFDGTAKDTLHLIVAVKEPAKENRANRAIIDAVANHLHIAPSRITMISGFTSRQKVLEIDSL